MTLSANALSEAHKVNSGEVWALLLEITHSTLTTPFRVTNAGENLTSNGDVFVNCPFDIQLPANENGLISSATLSIDNIDRSISAAVQSMQDPAAVNIKVVLASTPDTIEAEWDNFQLTEVAINVLVVTGTFTVDAKRDKGVPSRRFTPENAPGLFA